jgi:hypothetical protein
MVAQVRARTRDAKGDPIWEEVMPRLVGFGTFAALLEEQISEKISRRILSGDQGMIVWWSIGAGVHIEPHSHANDNHGSRRSRLPPSPLFNLAPEAIIVVGNHMHHLLGH